MSGIHVLILRHLQNELTARLITAVDPLDTARPSIVKIGPLQGEPDPDVARISLELYCNDPDSPTLSTGQAGWSDVIHMLEIGGAVTWERRLTIKTRVLLEGSREELAQAQLVASNVRSRIEKALYKIRWGSVSSEDEYVSRGVFSFSTHGDILQSGGPPDAYDFLIKIRFSILTTETVGA